MNSLRAIKIANIKWNIFIDRVSLSFFLDGFLQCLRSKESKSPQQPPSKVSITDVQWPLFKNESRSCFFYIATQFFQCKHLLVSFDCYPLFVQPELSSKKISTPNSSVKYIGMLPNVMLSFELKEHEKKFQFLAQEYDATQNMKKKKWIQN